MPDRGKETVECAYATSPSLLPGKDCLPHLVWDAVAECTPPLDKEEEEENKVELDRE